MQAAVVNDRLVIDGAPVRFVAVPHTSGARMEPKVLVAHDTAGSSMESSLNWFRDPRSKVSAHLIVGRSRGEIVQCVEFDRVAWHAGPSEWNGLANLNGCSIGIEFDNPGGLDDNGWSKATRKTYADSVPATGPKHSGKRWLPYTDWQVAVLDAVTRALVVAYPTIIGCAGHWEIDTRGWKEDPTPLFPWETMRLAMGDRPQPVGPEFVREAQEQLAALGYNPGSADGMMGPRTRMALRGFQEQNRLPITGQLDRATYQLLVPVDVAEAPPPKEMPLGARAEMEKVPGSRTQSAANVVQAGALTLTGLQVGTAVVEMSEAVGHVETGVRLADRIAALVPNIERLAAWLATPAGWKALGMLLFTALVWWLARRIKAWRLAAAKSGADTSR